MRKAMFFLGLWVVALVLSAMLTSCGRERREMQAVQGESLRSDRVYSYEFYDRQKKCTTGRHVYHSHERYCRALLNETVNSHCARQKRLEVYNLGCR